MTEQCYVHSKLLIADDRVAVLGSANINDRSMQGDRDSELAIIVNDDTKVKVALNGKDSVDVGAAVHDLRVRLWRKLFGLTDGATHPASSLETVLTHPASPATWQAIQKVAAANAKAYRAAFKFLPKAQGPSSIWPTWDSKKGVLEHYMPFNERFWRDAEPRDESFTWDAKSRVLESAPKDIQGFIVALPVAWTQGENNRSRMNLTLLANQMPSPTQNPEAVQSALASMTNTATAPQGENV
ncbi:Phospholipase D Active site motif protein [compost metagenome]